MLVTHASNSSWHLIPPYLLQNSTLIDVYRTCLMELTSFWLLLSCFLRLDNLCKKVIKHFSFNFSCFYLIINEFNELFVKRASHWLFQYFYFYYRAAISQDVNLKLSENFKVKLPKSVKLKLAPYHTEVFNSVHER